MSAPQEVVEVLRPRVDKEGREECQRCPRRTGTYVPPALIPRAALMVVGEAPIDKEVEGGEPFAGPSGKVLGGLLRAAGTERERVSLASAVCCYLPGNLPTGAGELACCAGVLSSAIREAGPRAILAAGPAATATLIGQRPLASWRGSVVMGGGRVEVGERVVLGPEVYKSGEKKGQPKPRREGVYVEHRAAKDIPVVITHHPVDLVRGGFEDFPLVVADVRRAVALGDGRPLIEVGGEIVTSARAEKFAAMLEREKAIVLDTETEGKNGALTLIGLAADEQRGISGYPNKATLEVIGKALTEPDRVLIGHNLAYDLGVLQRAGIDVECKLWDTMHAAHFERSDLPKGLDKVASRLGRYRYYNWKEAFRSGVNPDGQLYNALDCCWTAALAKDLRTSLAQSGRLKHFEEVLMPLVPVLREMEEDGIAIDQELLHVLRDVQQRVIQSLSELWERLTGGVNPASFPQLTEYFYGKLGLKVRFKRGTTRPTLDRNAVEKLFHDNPEVESLRVLVHLRHATNILATFLSPDTSDGRIHPQYNLSGTTTGRLSGGGEDGFNIQNVPRTGKSHSCPVGVDGCQCWRIRELFVGDEGDEGFAAADWSQIEFRLSALLAGEKSLTEAYARDSEFDIHNDVALRLGIPRDLAKRVVHGSNYGMGARKLAETIGCTALDAQRHLDAFRAAYPYLSRWRSSLCTNARSNGWVTNPFSRRAYFRVNGDGKLDEPKVIAFVPQSTALEMMLIAILRAHKAGLKLRTTVHDEIGISARTKDDVRVLKELMEEPYPQLGGWWCPADVKIGKSWAEAK